MQGRSQRPLLRVLRALQVKLFSGRTSFVMLKPTPMRKVSVRDLRYRFSAVEDALRRGEEIQITRRERVVARLLPPDLRPCLKCRISSAA